MRAVLAAGLLLAAAAAPQAHGQRQRGEGGTCVLADGTEGVCKYIRNCTWAMDEWRQDRPIQTCEYEGRAAVVCCPLPVAPSAVGRVARAKCKEYSAFVFSEQEAAVLVQGGEKETRDECAADISPLIVGGNETKSKEFPHMALVGYNVEDEVKYLCGGSLIAPQFVLTAAHCLYLGLRAAPARWVMLGKLYRKNPQDAALEQPQLIEVAERIKHPGYKANINYNDIALLRLKEAAQMSGFVRPACLHTGARLPTLNGSPVVPVATGWGDVGDDNSAEPLSNIMLKVALPVADFDQCRQSYTGFRGKLPDGIRPDSQLCAGRMTGKDTCQGDSGGPLQVFASNDTDPPADVYCMYMIVGVTSFGQTGCGYSVAGVYSRVFHFVPWIEGIVWPGE